MSNVYIAVCVIGFLAGIACLAVAVRSRKAKDEFVALLPCDSVYEHNSLWYFWDETWSNYYGPYQTEEIARDELDRYCESMGLGC